MTKAIIFFIAGASVAVSFVWMNKLWVQPSKQEGWTLSTVASTCSIFKTATATVFVMDAVDDEIGTGYDPQTRMCTVDGFLPIELKENTTYVFLNGIIIESTLGTNGVNVLYNMKDNEFRKNNKQEDSR